MADVLDEFRQFFEQPVDDPKEYKAQIQRGTPALLEVRDRISALRRTKGWKTGMTQEQAASNLIAQTIYAEVEQEIERAIRWSQEK